MGVSGSGKSTLGKALSESIKIPFFDADDFHPNENIQKMAQGIPLNDADRIPWLQRLSKELSVWNTKDGAILACSALKKDYRNILKEQLDPQTAKIHWVFLDVDREVLLARLNSRKGHFFPPELLNSQFESLEKPEEAIVLNQHNSIEENVMYLIDQLKVLS